MSLKEVAQRVAAKCYFKELATSRALKYDGVTCYEHAMRTQDEVYDYAFRSEKGWVWSRGSEPRKI